MIWRTAHQLLNKILAMFKWLVFKSHLFELANNDDSKNFIAKQAEENKYVSGIKSVMDDNPLPEFEKLEKYFAPQGGFMTSDDTGLHFLFFEMRPEPEDDE